MDIKLFDSELKVMDIQGAGAVRTLTRGVALGSELVGLSARARPPATLAASALKGQLVLSPGQRPGYQGIKPYAL